MTHRFLKPALSLPLVLAASAAAAAGPTAGVYFDPAGTQQTLELQAADGGSELVEVFVVLHDISDPVAGFEAGVDIPDGMQLFSVYPIGTEVDGCGFPPWDLGDMHCYGSCGFAQSPPQVIMRMLLSVPRALEDLVFAVGPAASGGVPGGTARLAAFECTNQQLVELQPAPSPYGLGGAAINPTDAVPVHGRSWSRIKALY